MDKMRLMISDVALGEPLPWDVYSEDGELLLRRGHVINHLQMLEGLFQRNLYIDGEHAHTIARNKNEEKKKPDVIEETPSILRILNLAGKRLERVLFGITNDTEFSAHVIDIARMVSQAAALDTEIAAACIVLNQQPGHYAVHHMVDTALLTCMVMQAMQKPASETDSVLAAALTMNLGMLRQHDHLQAKQGPLNDKEKEFIHRHPQESVAALKQAGVTDQRWLGAVLLHHESEHGNGYPSGKPVPSLPQDVKILALADHYCAAVADRKYKRTLTPPGALRDIFAAGGKPADPTLAAYFIKLLGAYPPGTFVRLQNNEIAVVTGKGETHTTPVVQSMIGASGTPLSIPLKRDTSKPTHAIRETLHHWEIPLRFSMQQLWGEHAAS